MDRITGIRNQNRIARRQRRIEKVGQALFGADGRDDLGFGVKRDAVAPIVPTRDRGSQRLDAARRGISVVFALAGLQLG